MTREKHILIYGSGSKGRSALWWLPQWGRWWQGCEEHHAGKNQMVLTGVKGSSHARTSHRPSFSTEGICYCKALAKQRSAVTHLRSWQPREGSSPTLFGWENWGLGEKFSLWGQEPGSGWAASHGNRRVLSRHASHLSIPCTPHGRSKKPKVPGTCGVGKRTKKSRIHLMSIWSSHQNILFL